MKVSIIVLGALIVSMNVFGQQLEKKCEESFNSHQSKLMNSLTSKFNQAISEKIKTIYKIYHDTDIDLSQIKPSMEVLNDQDLSTKSKKVIFYYSINAGNKSALIRTSTIEFISSSDASFDKKYSASGISLDTNKINCKTSMTVLSVNPNSSSREVHLYTNNKDFLYNDYSGFQLTDKYSSLQIPEFIPLINYDDVHWATKEYGDREINTIIF